MADSPVAATREPFVSIEENGEVLAWSTQRLWELSKSLPVFEYEVASFDYFDKVVWYGAGLEPTIKSVLDHYRRIEKANFEHPIIVSQNGVILDGIHRICRAHLDGRKTIPAVRFEVDPEPDRRHPIL